MLEVLCLCICMSHKIVLCNKVEAILNKNNDLTRLTPSDAKLISDPINFEAGLKVMNISELYVYNM